MRAPTRTQQVSRLTPLEFGNNSISICIDAEVSADYFCFGHWISLEVMSCETSVYYGNEAATFHFEGTKTIFMFGVLIVFAGRPFTTEAVPVKKEGFTPVATQLGGDVTFDIIGAVESQCQTHVGKVVVCFHGTTMVDIGPEFQNRISGSCDHIKLKDVQKGDLDHRYICDNVDRLKYASYTYSINAATAPPQNVSLSVNGSKVSVLWQPPPAHWQTGPILKYEVKMSCNATELLVDVNGTSTVLEGLPQGVNCTVSVAAVTSDGVEAWSKQKPVFIRLPGPSGITGTDVQPVEERNWYGTLASIGLFGLIILFLVLFWRKRDENSVSGPEPNAEQTERGLPLVPCAHHPVPSSA